MEWIIIILVVTNAISIVAAYRFFNRSYYLETVFEDMHVNFVSFIDKCALVLNTPRYMNEPVVMSFAEDLSMLYTFLKRVDNEYNFVIELDDGNDKSNLEKESGKQT